MNREFNWIKLENFLLFENVTVKVQKKSGVNSQEWLVKSHWSGENTSGFGGSFSWIVNRQSWVRHMFHPEFKFTYETQCSMRSTSLLPTHYSPRLPQIFNSKRKSPMLQTAHCPLLTVDYSPTKRKSPMLQTAHCPLFTAHWLKTSPSTTSPKYTPPPSQYHSPLPDLPVRHFPFSFAIILS